MYHSLPGLQEQRGYMGAWSGHHRRQGMGTVWRSDCGTWLACCLTGTDRKSHSLLKNLKTVDGFIISQTNVGFSMM